VTRRVLVTGASGFVGRHLIQLLAALPEVSVVGVVRTGTAKLPTPVLTFVGDLTEAVFVNSVMEETVPEVVYHLAAQSSVADSWADPIGTLVNNVSAQVNVLEAVAKWAPKARVLVSGSAEEYGRGRSEDLPLTENAELRPESPYAASKVAQDYLGLQYFLGRQLDVVRVRTFNLFGPGQSDRFAIGSFAKQIVEVEAGVRPPLVFVGNLTARRDFTDVRDAVRAYRSLVKRGASGEVYNVGGGGVHSIGDVLAALVARCERPIEVRVDPARFRSNDIPVVAPNIQRLREATGWEPVIPFDQSTHDILEFWRQSIRPGLAPAPG
jgi:GDP-4-dehydro-6-deoxy-D-mannose reductase